MRILIFILSCFSFLGTLTAQTAMERFQEGNDRYQEEEFEQAIEIYEALLEEKYRSDDLHYNLANAYYRNGQLASAILHYEKALKINPANDDARHNLEFANSRTVDKLESPPRLFFYRWWSALTQLMSLQNWAILLIIFMSLAVLAFGLYFFTGRTSLQKIGFYGGVAAILLSIFCWLVADRKSAALEKQTHAIIMEPTVDINSSPSEGSSRLFVLHEGAKVAIEDKSGDWLEISLPNGNSGWIKSSMLEVI